MTLALNAKYRLDVMDSAGDCLFSLPGIISGTWRATIDLSDELIATVPAAVDPAAGYPLTDIETGDPQKFVPLDLFDLPNEVWLYEQNSGTGTLKQKFLIESRSYRVSQGNVASITINGKSLMGQLARGLVTDLDPTTLVAKTIDDVVDAILAEQTITPLITKPADMFTDDPTVEFDTRLQNVSILEALKMVKDLKGGHYQVNLAREISRSIVPNPTDTNVRFIEPDLNLVEIEERLDNEGLITRLFAYGPGENDARINLVDAGQPNEYIDSVNTAIYGLVEGVFVFPHVNVPAQLLKAAFAYLAEVDTPKKRYSIRATEEARAADNPVFPGAPLELHAPVRLRVQSAGIDIEENIVMIERDLVSDQVVAFDLKDPSESLEEKFAKFFQDVKRKTTILPEGQLVLERGHANRETLEQLLERGSPGDVLTRESGDPGVDFTALPTPAAPQDLKSVSDATTLDANQLFELLLNSTLVFRDDAGQALFVIDEATQSARFRSGLTPTQTTFRSDDAGIINGDDVTLQSFTGKNSSGANTTYATQTVRAATITNGSEVSDWVLSLMGNTPGTFGQTFAVRGATGNLEVDGSIEMQGGMTVDGVDVSELGSDFAAIDELSVKGDLLTRDASAYAALAIGADDTILAADSAASTGNAWKTVASLLASLLSTKGDIAISNGSAVVALPVGADGMIFVVESLASNGAQWKTVGGMLDDLLTTKGDIISRAVTGTTRLPVGADGTLLQADSGEDEGVKWGGPTLADVAAFTTTNAESTFLMSSAVDVLVQDSGGNDVFRIEEGAFPSTQTKHEDGPAAHYLWSKKHAATFDFPGHLVFRQENANGIDTDFARISALVASGTASSEAALLLFYQMKAGTLTVMNQFPASIPGIQMVNVSAAADLGAQSNGAAIFSRNISAAAEVRVIDEAGNLTTIS